MSEMNIPKEIKGYMVFYQKAGESEAEPLNGYDCDGEDGEEVGPLVYRYEDEAKDDTEFCNKGTHQIACCKKVTVTIHE